VVEVEHRKVQLLKMLQLHKNLAVKAEEHKMSHQHLVKDMAILLKVPRVHISLHPFLNRWHLNLRR